MCVGPSETERVDSCPTRNCLTVPLGPLPLLELLDQIEFAVLEIDLWVYMLQVQGCWQYTVAHPQNHFKQCRHAGSSFKTADVALDRTDSTSFWIGVE